MTPKEIGRVAGRMFGATVPANWAIRSQEDQEDYGVDYEVELTTAGDKPTGFIFKIQQKGVAKAELLSDGQTISFHGLSTEKLEYYLHDLQIPLVFVVVDISSSKCYWTPVHGDKAVERRLDDAKRDKTKTVTLHLQARRVLPSTSSELLDEVTRMFDYITMGALKRMPLPSMQALLEQEANLDEIERNLRMQQAVVRAEKTRRLLAGGSLDDAFELNRSAFEDRNEPIESRFSAALELIRIINVDAARSTDPRSRENMLHARLTITDRLVSITRRTDSANHLRHYAILLARSARLRACIYRDSGIFLSRQAQQRTAADDLTRWLTQAAQHRSISKVVLEFRHCQRRLLRLLALGHWGLLVYAWNELSEASIPLLLRLKEDGLESGADSVRAWLDAFGDICFHIAKESQDEQILELCASNHVRLGIHDDSLTARVAESEKLLQQVSNEDIRKGMRKNLGELAEALNGPIPPFEPGSERLEERVRQMARGLGIDVDDPDDNLARVVRIGIKDADPTRVLQNCNNLLVTIESYGVPAEMLGLPTAGFKSIHCMKHGHSVGGLSLDSTYSIFEEWHCGKCSDASPHPSGWRWTYEWQREVETRHRSRVGTRGDTETSE